MNKIIFKNFFLQKTFKILFLLVLAFLTIIFLWKYLNLYLTKSKALSSSITLSLIPETTSLSNREVKGYELIAQFNNGSSAEKIDYLKLKINFPINYLELADYIDTSGSGIGRQIRVDNPTVANSSGQIIVELGASASGAGPATNSQPLIVAKINFRAIAPVQNGVINISDVEIYNNSSIIISEINKNNATFSILGLGPTATPTMSINTLVTRAEATKIILQAKHGNSFNPPTVTISSFADVTSDNPYKSWIEKFYNEGFSGGCASSPIRFCPDALLTRAEMAVFAVKGKRGSGFVPVIPPIEPFTDVPLTHWAVKWINQAKIDGLMVGYPDGLFRPNNSIINIELNDVLNRAFVVSVSPIPISSIPTGSLPSVTPPSINLYACNKLCRGSTQANANKQCRSEYCKITVNFFGILVGRCRERSCPNNSYCNCGFMP